MLALSASIPYNLEEKIPSNVYSISDSHPELKSFFSNPFAQGFFLLCPVFASFSFYIFLLFFQKLIPLTQDLLLSVEFSPNLCAHSQICLR